MSAHSRRRFRASGLWCVSADANLDLRSAVAERAGLSVGFISQIKRGLTMPSLSSIAAIAEALDSAAGEFLHQPRTSPIATYRGGREVLAISRDVSNRYEYERLSTVFAGSTMHSVLFHIPPAPSAESSTGTWPETKTGASVFNFSESGTGPTGPMTSFATMFLVLRDEVGVDDVSALLHRRTLPQPRAWPEDLIPVRQYRKDAPIEARQGVSHA